MKIVLEVDDSLLNEYSEHQLKMYCAVNLYRHNILGTSALADAVGISRMDFIDEMGNYGVGIINMNKNELKMELENAKKFLPV